MPTLADNGTTPYLITLGHDATMQEVHAAHALSAFLEQATETRFPIRVPEAVGNHLVLAVGVEAAVAAGLEKDALVGLGAEGLLVRTVGGNVILTGGKDAPRGTLYAVHTFLEAIVGFRWWTSTATRIPHIPTLEIGALDIREIPILEYREPFWFDAADGDWAVRNKANGHAVRADAARGGHHVYKGFVHTFYPLVPPEQHFDAHPEWFSEIDGKRTHERAQLCLTNAKLLDFMVERVKAWLRETPDATILSVSQNDWYGACQCEHCAAIDEEEGSHAGTLLRFVNAVAEAIEPEFPHVAIDTLAYQYTRKPPKITKPRPNVIVRLCSIECNFAQPLSHETNRAFREDIEGWAAICDRLYIWDYTTNFSHYVQPHPNWFVLGENIRFFVEHGVKGIFEQGAYHGHGAEMAELRAWVLAKLLWNPYQEDRVLIREFLEGYFGPAAPHLSSYMERVHTAAVKSGFHMGCFAKTDTPYLSPDVLLDAHGYFFVAERAVSGDATLLARVKRAKLPALYVTLLRWDEIRAHADKTEQSWLLPESRMETFEIFAEIYHANGMTQLAERSERNLDWLKAECGLAST